MEDRKAREEQKRTTGRFDVHAIMNRAFEMRRKAVEDSESDSEDLSDNDWDEVDES